MSNWRCKCPKLIEGRRQSCADCGAQKPLDTTDKVVLEGSSGLSGGLHPDGDSEGSAGVAPNGTESVQGKDEQQEDFWRWLMESNEPVAGISATNRDWHAEYPSQ